VRSNWHLFLWLENGNDIWVLQFGAVESGLVVGLENFHLDAEHSLSEEDVSNGGVDVLADWVTGVDHHTVDEFHGFRSLASDLTGDDNLATAGTVLHDESEHTVGGSSDGQTAEELVSEGLGLGDGGKASVGNSLDVEVDGTLLGAPSLVDDSGQFANSSGLLSENLTGSGGDDDDFAGFALSDDDATVAILSKLALEELVEFGLEHTISNKQVFLRYRPSLHLRFLSHFRWIRCYFFGLLSFSVSST